MVMERGIVQIVFKEYILRETGWSISGAGVDT